MAARIVTENTLKGKRCNPAKAGDLWVVVKIQRDGKVTIQREKIGAPTAANRSKAERRCRELDVAYGIAADERRSDGAIPHQFRVVARRYLAQMEKEGLAQTTANDRRKLLADGKRIDRELGDLAMASITGSDLWKVMDDVFGDGCALQTARHHLNVIAAVFAFAEDKLGLVDGSPVLPVRRGLARRNRTKSGRAEAAQSHANPIEDRDELARLVDASLEIANGIEVEVTARRGSRRTTWKQVKATSFRDHVAVLLLLDAGLRIGEAAGLAWRGIDLEGGLLRIHQTRPRGGTLEPTTKTGREREVGISARLGAALREWFLAAGRPDADELVLQNFHDSNFRRRHFAKACERAGLPSRDPKDLRDSFASHLISAGIPLAFVAAQLGHSQVTTTAKHYATWVGDGGKYRRPPELAEGMVPADLLASGYPAAHISGEDVPLFGE